MVEVFVERRIRAVFNDFLLVWCHRIIIKILHFSSWIAFPESLRMFIKKYTNVHFKLCYIKNF